METSNLLTLFGLLLSPLYGFIAAVAIPYGIFLWKRLTKFEKRQVNIDQKQDNLEDRIEENHDHITDIKGTHNPKDGCSQCKPKWRFDHGLPPFRALTQPEKDKRKS